MRHTDDPGNADAENFSTDLPERGVVRLKEQQLLRAGRCGDRAHRRPRTACLVCRCAAADGVWPTEPDRREPKTHSYGDQGAGGQG